jgi:hypothetical protein
MSNSTKCYQLTKASSGQTYAFVLGDALSMLKNDPKYPDFVETVQKLKNQILNTTGSQSWVTVGKKGKAMRLGEDQKPGAGWADKKKKKVDWKESVIVIAVDRASTTHVTVGVLALSHAASVAATCT